MFFISFLNKTLVINILNIFIVKNLSSYLSIYFQIKNNDEDAPQRNISHKQY